MGKHKPSSNFLLLLLTLFQFTLTFLIFILAFTQSVESQDTTGFFYCSASFCEDKLRLSPCPEKRNCSTTGFRTFLDPSECNCCDYCFDYLEENSTCSLNSPQKPIEMCGPHLECTPAAREEDPPTCQTITTGPKGNRPLDPNFCMTKRKEYLDAETEGTLGIVQFRPECDAGGQYAPRQCIPGSLCYCSNPEGQRIFGQALPHEKQDCACARDVARLQSYGFKGRMPHCFANGDYDELQCVVRSCYCRSYPDISYHPQNMTRLKCYNESLHVYKPDPDNPVYYLRPCEMERARAEIEIAEAALQDIVMVISDVRNCDPDGNFAPIQTDFDRQYCAHPLSGEVLEDYIVGKLTPEADKMNCYCARARYLMQDSATGKPQCCKNGNYRALQHIGSTWFCVDEYGRQDVSQQPHQVHEQEIHLLPCYEHQNETESAIPISQMGCKF